MENASKALLMAATVLIGVLLISLAVYLFTTFGDFSKDITEKLAQKDIDEFNAQFLKYKSYEEGNNTWRNTCRAQDVITVANIVKENNKKYDYTSEDEGSGYYFAKVIVKLLPNKTIRNFENESLDTYKDFLRNYSGNLNDSGSYDIIYFKCTNIEINPNSKRVCSITFEQL